MGPLTHNHLIKLQSSTSILVACAWYCLIFFTKNGRECDVMNYNMTVWILARNDINFSMAAGLIRLHMPGVK